MKGHIFRKSLLMTLLVTMALAAGACSAMKTQLVNAPQTGGDSRTVFPGAYPWQ